MNQMKSAALLILCLPCLCLGISAQPGAEEKASSTITVPTEGITKPARCPAPGETLTLEFPGLPPMSADGQPSICQIHIPATYTPEGDFPLLVWFSGGKGSSNIAAARELVDFDQFVVVTLPYPEGRSARLAVKNGTIGEFWDYLEPMMAAVRKTVPNISKRLRITGGSSNGAHLVGSAICQRWDGFSDYFTAYILHEGGYAPDKDYSAARGKRMLIVYGEKSTAHAWQLTFNKAIKPSEARLTFVALPDAGHGLTDEGRQRIREWTDRLLADSHETRSL